MVPVGISFIWKKKISLKNTLPYNKNTSTMDILYALTLAEFLSLFPGSFALIVVSTGISVFGGENLPKTHIGRSVAFPTPKTPTRWIVFYVL